MRIRANVGQVTRLLRSGAWRLQLGDDHAAQRGASSSSSCRAAGPGPGADQGPGTRTGGLHVVVHVGLLECGTESTVEGDWLIYYNHLWLHPAVPATTWGSVVVQRPPMVIPVECHYKRKQRVSGQPVSPSWAPMTSTFTAFGLLHFSLRTVTGDYATPHRSAPFQLGSLVILEASVEAPGHQSLRLYVDRCVVSPSPYPLASPRYEFITNHGCLVPGSPSAFLKRTRDDRLRFVIDPGVSVATKEEATMLYVGCYLSVTLAEKAADPLHKTCFLHGPNFSWHTVDKEGSSDVCACCRSNDCSAATTDPSGQRYSGAVAIVGPLPGLDPTI